ncbi:protein timeless [Tripterygium wilfordii]|uniref:Protein timeless n=1 Tax=Tripterygium wilfordii TaxID=458696 RepID=A0A7J7CE81_TRIWF|nr:protein timeless homolog [Tripterygium wilfordii]KAF5732400.1 protein timeless [Tripterygium wilfordii]
MDLQGLSLICSGLGVAEEDENGNRIGYLKGENCLDNLKDLLRFLRRDDPQTREVFKQVCRWNIVPKDLVPIMEHCQDDHSLVLNAVKVLVFLTMPVEPSSSDIPQQIEYLWGLKSAITCSNTLAVVVSLLEDPLQNLESESFTEDDWKLIQLVLTLFRNILAIQDVSSLQKAGNSASQLLLLRDKFLELLFHENIMDLVIVITQHVGGSCGYFRQDNLLLLEIFYYVFIGQEPELIAKAHLKDSKVVEKTKASFDNLKSIMEEEEEKRKLFRQRNMGRHSQFSGAFARLTMDGSKAVVKGNPTSASCNALLKPHKVQRGPTKKIVWDYGRLASTKDDILELLHNFIGQFLGGGYNVLMRSVREDIEKECHGIQSSDIIVFFHVSHFVTSFQYHKFLISKPDMETDTSQVSPSKYAVSTEFRGDICGPIAASMNEPMFLLVMSRWRDAFEGLKETSNYKFLSAAGSLMKTMIRMLDLILKLLPEDSREPQTARIMLYKLFYDQTDEGMTQFLLNLIKSFDTHKQPKSDLADLVEMIHVIVCLMENLQARGTLRVSKRSRKGRKKKASNDKMLADNELSVVQVNQVETGICNGERSTDLGSSHKERLTNAVCNGNEDVSIPDKVDAPEISVVPAVNVGAVLPQTHKRKTEHADDLLSGNSDLSGDELPAANDEVDFKVSKFISGFAQSSIIQNLCWLLKFYKSNSNNTNHYIIRMLRRITDELELSPMLYQLSLFTTFYDILVEQKSHPCEQYADIVGFLTSLVRKMLKKMRNLPLLFVDVLFWKNRKECHYINAEYLLHEVGNMKKKSMAWRLSNGETGASHADGWTHKSIADALGEDEADVMISHELGYQEENENFDEVHEGVKSVSGCEISERENADHERLVEEKSGRISGRKRRLVLTDELETKIKDLYEKFKDNWNCSSLIAQSLDPDGKISAAQVSNKLEQLGLQVVPKKRVRHAGISFPADCDQPGKEGTKFEGETAYDDSIVSEEAPLSLQPFRKTRKRVCAFSEDEEAMVKTLFEQFKYHKRCSYMIANALETKNTIAAAQVSHKLKELGLLVPRRKRSESSMYLRDEELDDFPLGKGHGSDDETLFSFMNRPKNKDGDRSSPEELLKLKGEGKLLDDSDDEIISSVLQRKKKDAQRPVSKELPNESSAGQFVNASKDETLNSGLQKKRKLLSKSKDEKVTAVIDENSRKTISTQRDVTNQLSGIDITVIDMGDTFSHISPQGTSEAEVADSINDNGVSLLNDVDDYPNHHMDDDLTDYGNDTAPQRRMQSAVLRRKLRVVVEDDD